MVHTKKSSLGNIYTAVFDIRNCNALWSTPRNLLWVTSIQPSLTSEIRYSGIDSITCNLLICLIACVWFLSKWSGGVFWHGFKEKNVSLSISDGVFENYSKDVMFYQSGQVFFLSRKSWCFKRILNEIMQNKFVDKNCSIDVMFYLCGQILSIELYGSLSDFQNQTWKTNLCWSIILLFKQCYGQVFQKIWSFQYQSAKQICF